MSTLEPLLKSYIFMYNYVFLIQNSWFIQHGLWGNTAQQIAHSSHVLTQRVLCYFLSNKIELTLETMKIYLFASGINVVKKIQNSLHFLFITDPIEYRSAVRFTFSKTTIAKVSFAFCQRV